MARTIAVIHHIDNDTTKLNLDIALSCGCSGAFLIDMAGDPYSINDVGQEARENLPSSFAIGGNRFTLDADAALLEDLNCGFDMTWCDNPGISNGSVAPVFATKRFRRGRHLRDFRLQVELTIQLPSCPNERNSRTRTSTDKSLIDQYFDIMTEDSSEVNRGFWRIIFVDGTGHQFLLDIRSLNDWFH